MPGIVDERRGELRLDPREIFRASTLLRHLSDPTRLRIAWLLSERERSVVELCDLINKSQPEKGQAEISHHLALLRHGRIVTQRKEGDRNFYRVTETGSKLLSALTPLLGQGKAETTEVDWEGIDDAVQFILDDLAEDVRRSSPPIMSMPGSTSARAFRLFSYRTFDAPEGETIDAVIVGLLFEEQGDRVAVSGDISGESTGMVFHEVLAREVPRTHVDVRAAAEEVATELAGRDDVLIAGFEALRRRALASDPAE